MKITIYYSVNMGMCVALPGHNVWVDAFPDYKTPSFSKMTDDEWEHMKRVKAVRPTEIIHTHCHPDHFSLERAEECAVLFPDAVFISPVSPVQSRETGLVVTPDHLPGIHVSGEEYTYTAGAGFSIRFVKTQHSSPRFANVPHYSIFIRCDGRSIFISGDARIHEDNFEGLFDSAGTDLAILNFPWASVSKGRELVKNVIRPKHVLLVHIPNAEDNIDHYREIAEGSADSLDVSDVKLALTPYTEFSYDLS